jgi:N-acetylglucosamine kinase-like BadF-type ATPase
MNDQLFPIDSSSDTNDDRQMRLASTTFSATSVYQDRWSVGVDGGGTKTLAIIVDSTGRERGRGIAGSANHQAVGIEAAHVHITSAIEAAATQAGITLPLHAAWFGLAGVDHPSDHTLLTPLLQPFAHTIHLTNDAELVLSALPNSIGIALIAGTGSIALGQNADGVSARAGGWGHLIGDEGSGYDLGRQCLQAVSQAADGRARTTSLTDLVLQHWHLAAAEDIINKVYNQYDKAAIAALSPLVCSAAREGDEVALAIITNAAHSLAQAVSAVQNRLGLSTQLLNLAFGGGLLLYEPSFRQHVITAISSYTSLGEVFLVDEPALSGARGAPHVS